MQLPKRLTLEMVERIIADAVMVNLALLTAFALRFLSFFVLGTGGEGATLQTYSGLFQSFCRAYLSLFWLLTLICLIIFYLSGFYTHGRAYRSRYKALIIFQAVSLSYLLFGFLTYFVHHLTPFPRSVLILGWLLTLVLVGGLRVGATLWRRVVWAEAKRFGKPQEQDIRHVTVIGGAGYIGSVLVRKLLHQGYTVTVLDGLLYGDESIRDLHDQPGFDLIHDDLRNIEAGIRALQYADAVVHLGALVGDPACALDEKLTLEINLAATRMIAEAARGFGVQRFIFASTCSVYGASDQVLDEHSALNPICAEVQRCWGAEVNSPPLPRPLAPLFPGSSAPSLLCSLALPLRQTSAATTRTTRLALSEANVSPSSATSSKTSSPTCRSSTRART